MNITLTVKLRPNRAFLGHASLLNAAGEMMIERMACLGLADLEAARLRGNAGRDSLFPFGNTPCGYYRMIALPAAVGALSEYGPHGRFLLCPMHGPCVEAEDEMHARSGLMIHGGDLNLSYQGLQGLRPTFGSLRFSNDDMARLCNNAVVHPAVAGATWCCDVSEEPF